jgi:hypothetical protein
MSIIFIGVGILVQQTFSQSGRYSEDFGGNTRMLANTGMIAYIVIGLVYLISSLFALNFGNKVGRALKTNDQVSLNSGFSGLRNYFAFWTILSIIALLLMLIAFAGLIAGGGR